MRKILSNHHIQAEEGWDLCMHYLYRNLGGRCIRWHAERNIDGSERIKHCISKYKPTLWGHDPPSLEENANKYK